jgi:hypothetical protein
VSVKFVNPRQINTQKCNLQHTFILHWNSRKITHFFIFHRAISEKLQHINYENLQFFIPPVVLQVYQVWIKSEMVEFFHWFNWHGMTRHTHMHFTQHVAWMGYMPKGTQHSYYIYDLHYGEDIRSKLTVHNTTPNSTIPLVSTSQISIQPRGLARKILQRIQRSYAYIYIHIFINVRWFRLRSTLQ